MRTRMFPLLLAVLFTLPLFAGITGSVISSDGQPIAGATVSLFELETFEAQQERLLSPKPERAPLATATTDSKGTFSLESPKSPVVVLRAEARGYAPEFVRVLRDDEASMVMTPAESKEGTITANGKPLAGALVAWMVGAETLARTDAQGKYSVPDPARWANRLIIIHPDYPVFSENVRRMGASRITRDRTLTAGITIQGRVVGSDGKTPIARASIRIDDWPAGVSGDDGTFTIKNAPKKWEQIEARSGSMIGSHAHRAGEVTIRLSPGATISGRVRDLKTGAPVAGTMVSVGAGGPMMPASSEASAMVDAKGNFSLGPILPGAYQLRGTRPRYTFNGPAVNLVAGSKVVKELTGTHLGQIAGTVLDEDKKPVAGARVAMHTSGREIEFMMLGTPRAIGVTSGPDGRFLLSATPDTDLELLASKKGLPSARSATVRVAGGERKSGVTITIPAGFPVTGKVVDGDGRPLAGVAVAATESQANEGGGMRRMIMANLAEREEEFVRTASDGTFTVKVKEGTYDVNFKREGFAPKTLRAITINASLKPVEVTLAPGVEVSGRITRSGVGIEGVNINLISEDGPVSVATAFDGSFRISDLTPGQQMMLAANKREEFIQQVRPVTPPATDVLIEIPPGGRITGRVVDKSSKRPVTSFQAGISTSRSGGGMMMMTPPMLRGFTSDEGAFTLENVPAGPTQVVVNAPGYTTGRAPNITVEEGKTVENVEIALDTGVKLTGRVTGPTGSALAGVNVRIDMQSGRVMRMPGPVMNTVTDSNGEYTFEALEAGERSFVFNHRDYMAAEKTIELSGNDARLDVQLSTGMTTRGVVVTEDGAPVAEAIVSTRTATEGARSGRSGRTDSNGAFQLEGMAPGRYTFTAGKRGFGDGRLTDVDITAGTPIRIMMKSGGSIYGRVTGLTESELQSASVSATSATANASAPVDTAGNFRIEGAPTGTVRVTARTGAGFGNRKTSPVKSVQVEAGSSVQVEIEFKSDTVIRGHVTRNGQPVLNSMVSFSPRNSQAQTFSNTTTDSNGDYEISGLDDATYTVMVVDLQRSFTYNTTHEVRGSGTFNIDVKTGGLRGRVVDSASGEAVEGAIVQIRRGSGSDGMFPQSTTQSDAGGTFSFDSVSAGSYHVMAEKEGYGNRTVDISLSEGGTETVDIKLMKNDGVTLKVVDGRDGRALNARARVYDAQNRVAWDTQFRGPGGPGDTLKLTLAAGSYRAFVGAQGYAPRWVVVNSPSSQTVAITPGGTIVVKSGSGDLRRARLIGADGREYYRGLSPTPIFTIDPRPGSTQLDHIAPGTYTLQILGTNESIVDSVQVTVVEAQVATADI